jgi:GMP synthase-like glutamine amidotransferase
MRIGRNAYGLQFHFEVTPGMVGSWVAEAKKGGGSDDYGRILEETESRRKIYQIQAHQLLENFYKIMIKRSLCRVN